MSKTEASMRTFALSLALLTTTACGPVDGTTPNDGGNIPADAGTTGSDGGANLPDDAGLQTPIVDDNAALFQEVSIFQAVRIPLYDAGTSVLPSQRRAPVIANRDGILRAKFDLPPGFTTRDLTLDVTIGSQTFTTTQSVSAASTDAPTSGIVVDLPASALTEDATISVELLDGDTILAALDTRDLGVFATGNLRVRFVPYEVNGFVPDTSPEVVEGLRQALFAVFPVADVDVSVADVVVWTEEMDMGAINVDVGVRQETAMIDGTVPWNTYFYAMATGVATREEFTGITGTSEGGGSEELVRAYFAAGAAFGDQRSEDTLIHEIGHTHQLLHTDCDGESNVDEDYPHAGGAVGVEGYDLRSGEFVSAEAKSMMAYCYPRWISDYSFGKLADHVAVAQAYAGYD